MSPNEGKQNGNMWFWLAVLVFLVALAYTILVLTGILPTSLNNKIPFVLLGAAGVISLAGWWRERAKLSAEEEDARQERDRLESKLSERETHLHQARDDLQSAKKSEETHRREREQMEPRLKGNEQELSRERYLRMRSEQARESEKDWCQQLHHEVMRLSNERGAFGSPKDVPEMVLRLSRTLSTNR
jgi:myosin heavy subunit